MPDNTTVIIGTVALAILLFVAGCAMFIDNPNIGRIIGTAIIGFVLLISACTRTIMTAIVVTRSK